MLKKKNKLSKKDFNSVFSSGKKINSPLFFVTFKKQQGEPQFSFVVPKKINTKATERNLIKRRLFFALKDSYFLKRNFKDIKIVFISRKNLIKIPDKELVFGLNKIYEQISGSSATPAAKNR